jgi:ricin-type beta-trefoil lectin protein/lysozyme-like protein
MSGLTAIRARLSLLTKIGLSFAAVGLAVALPARAASAPESATAAPQTSKATTPMIAPLAAPASARPADVATAAATCALYAIKAGWANNGYYAGDLVTAAAVCGGESGGDPRLYVCDENGKVVGQGEFVPGKPIKCPTGTTSYDRGLWQLNSVAASSTGDTCAFNPVCNAGAAYIASDRGTNFSPWSSYDSDNYRTWIDPAQTAVTGLHSGTVTSAELGECLQAKSAAGAKVVVANCGPGGKIQQWAASGGKLRSGSVCATISSTSAATPGVVLRQCAPRKTQRWSVAGRDELRNASDGKCLTDPNGALAAGTHVIVTKCANAKDQTWWLP